jgi:hypothetical protein
MLAAEKIMMPVSKGDDADGYFQLQYIPFDSWEIFFWPLVGCRRQQSN